MPSFLRDSNEWRCIAGLILSKVLKEWVLATFDLRTDRQELELVTQQFQAAHVSWLLCWKKSRKGVILSRDIWDILFCKSVLIYFK